MKLATQTSVFAAALAASNMSGLGAMAHADPTRICPTCRPVTAPAVGWARRFLSLTATGCRTPTAHTGMRFSTGLR